MFVRINPLVLPMTAIRLLSPKLGSHGSRNVHTDRVLLAPGPSLSGAAIESECRDSELLTNMPKILVADDNVDNRDSLSRRLMRRGFTVVTAADGEEAVRLTLAERPDLVLMDMNMPTLDGWEATRQIRGNADVAATPVIALTAYALAGERERALEAGCLDYHTKPFEFTELMQLIARHLDSRSGGD